MLFGVGLVCAVGCAQIIGLGGGYTDTDGAASVDASDAASDASVADVDASDAGCVTVAPDDDAGIFVAPSGTTDSACGTETVPCSSVQTGIERAHLITGKSIVYVARGTYAEAITLYAGITVEGGWDVLAEGTTFSWVQACTNPSAAFVLQPTSGNQTVTAADLGGSAVLSTMTVMSKSQANPGESLYGISATGVSTTLTLTDVIVNVSAGGDGAPGDAGSPGDAGGGECVPGDSGTPSPGAPGLGAEAGTFDDGGWESYSGAAGTGGAPGGGVDGGAGTCLACGTCGVVVITCKFTTNGVDSCGSPGVAGCGGAAGGGGNGGGGGGSSIGVFVWDATVSMNGGSVQTSNGGRGGTGGTAGPGGAGDPGIAGEAGAPCSVSCNTSCNGVSGEGEAGAPGGAGTGGSAGGLGGGGSGGSSYAIAQGGQANVTVTTTSLAHGDAGSGGGPDASTGAAGFASSRFP